jgi:cytoskeleton protein RodZ
LEGDLSRKAAKQKPASVLTNAEELSFGGFIRARREQLNLSPEELARLLFVRPELIVALEEERWGELPPPVYLRGLTKLIARVLSLPEQELLKAFAAAYPEEKPAESPAVAAKLPHPFVITPRLVLIVSTVLIALLAGGYVIFQILSFARPPNLELTQPPPNLEISAATVTVAGRTEPDAVVTINGERTLVNPDGSFSEEVGLRDGINVIEVKATSVFGKTTYLQREILAKVPGAARKAELKSKEPSSQRVPLEPEGRVVIEVEIKAQPTWLSVSTDGKIAFQGLLLPGSRRSFEAEREILLTTGKGEQTNVTFQGKRFAPVSTTPGVVRGIRFTAKGMEMPTPPP